MKCWPLSKLKPYVFWLLILMMAIFVVRRIQGGCIEEERKALLEIKASINSDVFAAEDLLPTWVDHGSTGGGADCCYWERVKCSTTTRHVTELSLHNLMGVVCEVYENKIWPLNVSLFLHFKELRSLNLSWDCLDNGIVTTGLERLSSLKKLEILDLSGNRIENGIFPSLGALTSLRILDLSGNYRLGDDFSSHEFAALENLEILDLTGCGFYGTFQLQGVERLPILTKLQTLNLGYNRFNKSVISSLSALSSLKALDLRYNQISGSFPAQDCKNLSRLKRLESIAIGGNHFNKSIISCLSALPSLKILDLSGSFELGSSFPIQELSGLRELDTLDLSGCHLDSLAFNELHVMPDLEVLLLKSNRFNGTIPMEALASFNHLEVLDLSFNSFVGSIPSAIRTSSSLRAVSFAHNELNGSLPDGLCELKSLHELDLSGNMFEGNLPQCFNGLSSLKLFDISSNRFTGTILSSLIANLTSIEYINFSHNQFEGSFLFSSFSNHTKLEVAEFINDNDKFEVETEEPLGWIPMFQLKVLVLSNCNDNKRAGSLVPSFLFYQDKLRVLDLSHNSLDGQLPNWLIENNTMLELVSLKNNSFGGRIHVPPYGTVNMQWLDMSGNQIEGPIPTNTQTFLPCLTYLNLSGNVLSGALPSSIGDLSQLYILDLSDNEFSGEVPKGLFTNIPRLGRLKLSNNKLHGEVLSGNISLGYLYVLLLDNNSFMGQIGNETTNIIGLDILDISTNFFSGRLPGWISNMASSRATLVARNNRFEGQFPCGTTSFFFVDISQNSLSGSIPSCLNMQDMEHLHLGSNRFTGSIPQSFRNLTNVLTLDIGNNNLSGTIPEFLGELSNLRILLFRKNNFSGSIPKQLCQLSNVSMVDLSNNSFSGSIPYCLHNISRPSYLAFIQSLYLSYEETIYVNGSVLQQGYPLENYGNMYEMRDKVEFTTKSMSLPYKGGILDYMVGLDLSCNKLTGEIPHELGLLTQIRALNLSHNQLTGSIPVQFSNLAKIESLDLSSNGLSGKVPSELIKLNSLAIFMVTHNNLSDSLPEMKALFSTFGKESYEGNPLLCGPPVEKKCRAKPSVIVPSTEEETKEWDGRDVTWFFEGFSAVLFVFLSGFVALLYSKPYWRRRWFDFIG